MTIKVALHLLDELKTLTDNADNKNLLENIKYKYEDFVYWEGFHDILEMEITLEDFMTLAYEYQLSTGK